MNHTGPPRSLVLTVHLSLVFAALLVRGAEKPAGSAFNVKDYGAAGDGKAPDMPAISRTVRACARAGGGTVVFPAGEYVTGTFELLADVTLHLESGAVLKGSTNLADYGLKSQYGLKGNRSGQSGEGLRAGLIVANQVQNIAITGPGVIDGRGTYFVNVNTPHYGEPPDFDKRYTRQRDDFMNPKFGVNEGPVRPWMAWNDRPGTLVILAACTNVLVRDVTLRDSHNWTLNLAECEQVEIRGLNVLNNLLIPNNDGINITARNARISDCNIWAGDDAIAANRCENLAVANCILASRSSAIRFAGGKYCTFQNLVIRDSNRGIGVYGAADTVSFSDILIQTRLHTGHWWGKGEPIHISTRSNPDVTQTAAIQHLRFSNIQAESESGILVYGTETRQIQDLVFERIRLRLKAGAHSDAVGGNFDLRGLGGGLASAIFKHDIPGVYCQYVNGLRFQGFDLEWADSLPDYFSDGIHCEHFSDILIDGFAGRQAQATGAGAALVLKQGTGVSLRNCVAGEGTSTFLSIEKVQDQRMFVNNDLRNARQATQAVQLDFHTSTDNSLSPALPPGTAK